ncbi:hypothetical protein BLA29_013845 [Euroglyphus maynei]|uniref:Uncharacterized protein n=1 Tax=Euroglyphus maynei TaxID=6958 RepID=A0A1Y3BQ00_EURMA|nr:hypothetical protein BLA29_013845 [Euroglyphus maynei]
MFWIKLLSISSLFIITINGESRYLLKHKPNCTENHLKQIELKVAKMMPIGPFARKLPENFDQAKGFCK